MLRRRREPLLKIVGELDRLAPPARAGGLVAALVYAALLFANAIPLEVDGHDYWSTDPSNPYVLSHLGIYGQDAFFYSPAFAQVIGPLHVLPWPVFAGVWALVMTGVLLWLTGRWFGWTLIIPFVAIEFAMGNVHLFLAGVIVAGFRYPGLWAFAFVTKVSPGIGILWFAFRREWRALAIVIGTTATIVAISFALAPSLWGDWIAMLAGLAAKPAAPATPFDVIPRPVRWLLAVALLAWGARTERRWVVPVAVTLSLPMIYLNGLAILVAAPILWARDRVEEQTRSSAVRRHRAIRMPPAPLRDGDHPAPSTAR